MMIPREASLPTTLDYVGSLLVRPEEFQDGCYRTSAPRLELSRDMPQRLSTSLRTCEQTDRMPHSLRLRPDRLRPMAEHLRCPVERSIAALESSGSPSRESS